MTQAEIPLSPTGRSGRPLLVAGGNVPLAQEGSRSWRTNLPVHLAVVATAALTCVMSPTLPSLLLAAAWVLVYLLGHWAHMIRQLPAAGVLTVVGSSALALALMGVAGNGVHLFIAYPLIWLFLTTFRQGLIATVLVAVSMITVLTLTAETLTLGIFAAYLAFGVGVALFSILMSMWIWRVETLAHEHRELAEQLQVTVADLEATRAELAASEHARGAEEERARFAADIHDTLAQSFTSITMLTQAARQSALRGAAEPSVLLAQIEEASRNGLAEARGLIARHQQPLDLASSIERLTADLAERTGIRVSADTARWVAAPTRTEVVLLRTAQEALRNIENHAGARTVHLRLARGAAGSAQAAELEVSDDGTGFDPALPTAGFGLLGMRSRLETEGGSLQVDTGRGSGTRLTVRLPLSAEASTDPPAEDDHEGGRP